MEATARSAPSRSALLTTKMSAISMMPALSACTSSPLPGTVITIEISAVRTMSISSCPTPTVSISTTSFPAASSTSATSVGRARESSEMSAGRHTADEHAGVAGVRLHAHAIPEDRSAGERARRIDGNDADGAATRSNGSGQFVDEGAFSSAWRPGDADEERASGPLKDAANQVGAGRRLIFDERDGAGDGAGIPRENAVGQRALGHSRCCRH